MSLLINRSERSISGRTDMNFTNFYMPERGLLFPSKAAFFFDRIEDIVRR